MEDEEKSNEHENIVEVTDDNEGTGNNRKLSWPFHFIYFRACTLYSDTCLYFEFILPKASPVRWFKICSDC